MWSGLAPDVDEQRLRFDFSHFSALTPEELFKVEKLVNEEILSALPIETMETNMETAKKAGALALCWRKIWQNGARCKNGRLLH